MDTSAVLDAPTKAVYAIFPRRALSCILIAAAGTAATPVKRNSGRTA